jgi:hypothetical protein
MLTKLLPKTGLMSLFVVAAVCAPTGADAGDLKAAQQQRSAEVTGAIDVRAAGVIQPAPVVSRARAAFVRFTEARTAMEHGLLLRETPPKSDLAAIRSGMKDLLDDLSAVEQMEQSRFASSAKEAKRLADDWYQSGMKIIAPPALGVTEMPLPMLVKGKAEAVATALDRLVEETTANTAVAANASARAVTPVKAALSVNVQAPQSMSSLGVRSATPKALLARMPKPMTQNQASLRLMREALPLLIPPAALLQNGDANKR